MSLYSHTPILILFSVEFLRILWHVRSVLLALAACITGGAALIAHFEKLPFADALYFALITGLTVGYGDIAPQTAGGRLTAVLIAVVGVIFSGLIVAAALRAVGESRKHLKAK
jgi:voltage-gated potassium channel